MFVCPELIEEPGRFRKLFFGISGQNSLPPSNKLRFPVENFHTSQRYDVISGFRSVKYHINAYNSHPNRVKNLKL